MTCTTTTKILLNYGDDGALGDYGNIMAVTPPTDWVSVTTYAIGDFTKLATGELFECTVGGISGGTEPTWDLVLGNTTIDGSVTWTSTSTYKRYQFVQKRITDPVDLILGGEINVDDFGLLAGDSVWVTGQTNPTENGLYTVETGAWSVIEVPVLDATFIDLGATAFNSADGDLTRDIVSDISSLDFTTTGFYSIVHTVTDSTGNVTTKVRKVKVVLPSASISPVSGFRVTQYDIISGTDDDLAKKGSGTQFDTRNGDGAYTLPETPAGIAHSNNLLYIRRDGTIPFIANQSMGGYRLTEVADPIDNFDAVNLRTLTTAINNDPIVTTVPSTSTVAVDLLDPTSFRTVKWLIEISDPVTLNYYSSQVYFVNTPTGGEFVEYSIVGNATPNDYLITVDVNAEIELNVENTLGTDVTVSIQRVRVA
jgi:hypothetical protein